MIALMWKIRTFQNEQPHVPFLHFPERHTIQIAPSAKMGGLKHLLRAKTRTRPTCHFRL
jgi:hypothetical protein